MKTQQSEFQLQLYKFLRHHLVVYHDKDLSKRRRTSILSSVHIMLYIPPLYVLLTLGWGSPVVVLSKAGNSLVARSCARCNSSLL